MAMAEKDAQKILYDTFHEIVTNEMIIKDFKNPLIPYINNSIKEILEVGTNSSSEFVLSMIGTNNRYNFTAVDDEHYLNQLKERISNINPDYNLETIPEYLPNEKVDFSKYDLIIFKNVFHLKEFNRELIAKQLNEQMKHGAFLYLFNYKNDWNTTERISKSHFPFDYQITLNLFPESSFEYLQCKTVLEPLASFSKDHFTLTYQRMKAIDPEYSNVNERVKHLLNIHEGVLSYESILEKK